MTQLIIDTNLMDALIKGMNSRTIVILHYLVQQARSNNNLIRLKYRDIENVLNLGHTTVGNNMRFLIQIKAVEKISKGTYKINSDLINIQKVEKEF